MSGLKSFWNSFSSRRPAVAGLIVLLLAMLVALLASVICREDPYSMTVNMFRPPSPDHPMGTDNMGRDMLARMAYGTRVSLLFAFCAAGISLAIGIVLGALAGYFGGVMDDLLSRVFEVFLIIPRLFLIILLVAFYGNSMLVCVVVIGMTIWPSNARIMRAQVLTLKSRSFVQAAIGTGASNLCVLFKHIVPNGIAAVIANSTLQMAQAVLLEAGLSFLGLGDPNRVSWGQILYQGQYHLRSAWWMVVFPGAALLCLLLALHMVGDGLGAALNPRLREREAWAE